MTENNWVTLLHSIVQNAAELNDTFCSSVKMSSHKNVKETASLPHLILSKGKMSQCNAGVLQGGSKYSVPFRFLGPRPEGSQDSALSVCLSVTLIVETDYFSLG